MRCQACDSIMDSDEIIWLPDKKSHEPLCKKCRYLDRQNTIMYFDDGCQVFNHTWAGNSDETDS